MNKRFFTQSTTEQQKKEFQDFLKYNELFKALRKMLQEDLDACQMTVDL